MSVGTIDHIQEILIPDESVMQHHNGTEWCEVNGLWHDKCCGMFAGGPGACTWRIVANWGCGADDWFHRGNPLWVVDHLDEVGWRRLWGWIEMRWWWA